MKKWFQFLGKGRHILSYIDENRIRMQLMCGIFTSKQLDIINNELYVLKV